ncbi:MAG: hypothetical protein HQ478_13960 [Chloroflexi bacterium]|nr:hypothetical protein [Chloroflexota bacterium]
MSNEAQRFFTDRIPGDWFESNLEIISDRDEILVTGDLADPQVEDASDEDAVKLARAQAVNEFREATRDERMKIADEAETLFGRKVSWGAGIGDQRVLFTHLGVPVMSRLRLPERETLDTLVTAGVARNRSDALAWCVKYVRKQQADWLAELQEAFTKVEEVRSSGPNI